MITPEIIAGDVLDILPGLDDNSVDLIVADPPYNLDKDYGNRSDSFTSGQWVEFSEKWIKQAHRVLSETGTIYIFMGFRNISTTWSILEKLNMNFVNWITWHYTQGTGKTRGFSPRHEDILMFSKTRNYKFNLNSIRVPQKYYRKRNNMSGANPGDVWEFSHVHYCKSGRRKHPTQKPEGVIERMVLASTDPGDTVLDLFSGTGTCSRVCQILGRNCKGIEINPDFVDLIIQRLGEPFELFDSIDSRLFRIPDDLRTHRERVDYLLTHLKNFILPNPGYKHHLKRFYTEIELKYDIKTAMDVLGKAENEF
ncbi:MAG: site-specific DNA-methyltransferase [Deltaproteobacteria bacterium]|nr:site-specific DNA-methyltransferase [Deltaproteobacteria bacterium]